jgi:hypothetical protein
VGVETHNFKKSREYVTSVTLQAGTHRMTELGDVDPDEEDDGDVPIL